MPQVLTEASHASLSSHRKAIRSAFLADENGLIHSLLEPLLFNERQHQRIYQQAAALVQAHHHFEHRSTALDALLQEYALSSEEGVALMSLAESLLRIPDTATADELIGDKLTNADWQSHIGHSAHPLVNASAWGLLLTGKLLGDQNSSHESMHPPLHSALRKLGQPVVRQVLRFTMGVLGEHFVLGSQIEPALNRAGKAPRYRYSFDMLGEGARTAEDAQRYYQRYAAAIAAIGQHQQNTEPWQSHGVSIKLSALHPRFEYGRSDTLLSELRPRLSALATSAARWNINLTIDAEESWRLEPTLEAFEWLWRDPALQHWQGLGLAVQAYQKRALPVIDWALALADDGRRVGIRLVKGAYWDSEIKAAQELGLADYPVFTRKAATDLNYLHCAQRLLQSRSRCYPQFATHNAHTLAAVLELASDTQGFEFQRLHGMGEGIYHHLLQHCPVPCRVYAPVGEHQQLLPYLVRRLLENGANSSFVNQLAQTDADCESLLRDPRDTLRSGTSSLPRPASLYGAERLNAKGYSLADPHFLDHLTLDFARRSPTRPSTPEAVAVHNPARRAEIVGHITFDTPETLRTKLANLHPRLRLSRRQRAETLQQLASALEGHCHELMWYCIKEAGKTLADALAEVREAVDFCRYYAARCQHLPDDGRGLGTVLCISPWNFPLTILTGQICAALAAGNTVLAKPAEQTSLIANRLLQLLRQCGLDEGCVAMALAPGQLAGEHLLGDPRIRAVMFTGSCATARWINQRLAQRSDAPVPLIAETGGVNAMVVDSSALHEQAIDHILQSAFYSAGQRCSALRVLYLQEDIAAPFTRQLCGAMAELRLGDPARLDTDIGPLIDDAARQRLNEHVGTLQASADLIAQTPLPADCGDGHFFAPQLWAIDSIAQIPNEVFGPLLHVVTYAGDEIDQVIEEINRSGYGLTFGLQSRIQRKAYSLARAIACGNVYINRNMVGAVVGVQPFGGRGLSGTGPKAGGPLMLHRLSQAPPTPSSQGIPLSGIRKRLSALLVSSDKRRDFVDQLLQQAEQLLGQSHDLPGPTGERNQLLVEAGGHYIADYTEEDSQQEAWLIALAMLACDNTLQLHLPAAWREAFADLPQTALTLSTAPLQPSELAEASPLNGVVISERNPQRQAFALALSQRPGPLCPLLSGSVGELSLYPFVKEKTISENTAAIGGNAALLSEPRR